jgi:hypothetical protein
MNPQFHIQIPRTSSNKCHVVVSVTQFYETVSDSRKKKPLFAIGFAVYEVPHATARLTPHFVAEQVFKPTVMCYRHDVHKQRQMDSFQISVSSDLI